MDPDLSLQIRNAVAADRETVRRLVCDIPPAAEPVEDYITDLDERCRLFDELRQLYQQLDQSPPNAATLGFVMVAPIEEIRVHISTFGTMGNFVWAWAYGINAEASQAMAACTFLPSSRPTLPNIFLDIPKSRVVDPPSSLPMAASPATLNEPGMPISTDQVKRSGAATRNVK